MANHNRYMKVPQADLTATPTLYDGTHQTATSARQTLHGTANRVLSVDNENLTISSIATKFAAYAKLSHAEALLECAKVEWTHFAQALSDADSVGQQFLTSASMVGKVKAGSKIKVAGSTRHNGDYTVSAVSAGAVTVSEAVVAKVAGDVFGNLLYKNII